MARKLQTKRKVRKHDPQKPPLPKPLPPGIAHQAPVPDGAELQAQRLIRNVGSAEGAKKLIDATTARESASDFLEDRFAIRWGFTSRQELLSASRPVFPDDTSNWWATELKNGRWIVWSRDDLSSRDTFSSYDDAKDAVSAPVHTDESAIGQGI